MRYLDCLIGEADMLFTRFTREDINEATQLYLLAADILGDRPTLLPAQEAALLTPNLLLGRLKLILGAGLPFDPLDQLASLIPTSLSGLPSSRSGLPALAGSNAINQSTRLVISNRCHGNFGPRWFGRLRYPAAVLPSLQ